MKFLRGITGFLNKLLLWIGGLCLGFMILITCTNIVMRQVWVPVPGTVELLGYAGALATAFALGFSQSSRSHISVDVLVNTYPRPVKRFMTFIGNGLTCAFFAAAAWHVVHKAMILRQTGEVSETLRIVFYPVVLAVALGCLSLALTLLTDFLSSLFPSREDTP